MSGIYKQGETKVRPGMYRRQENRSKSETASAVYGVFAIPVQADWGPMGTVTTHTRKSDLRDLYGTGGTIDAAEALFTGGATKVFAYRLGTGGEKGKLQLKNGQEADMINLETKYESDKEFKITLREKLGDNSKKEFIVYEGTSIKETLVFDSGSKEAENLISKINNSSSYFVAAKETEGSGTLASIDQITITKGSNPSVTNSDYSDALLAFEAFKWNVLALDSISEEVQTTAIAYIDRIYEDGALGVCVIGKDPKSSFDERLTYAKSINNEKVICLGSGYVDKNEKEECGYQGFALQAGIIGSTQNNRSITHTVISGAVNTLEALKKTQYEKAISNGLLLLSPTDDGQVWFDAGINTLTVPGEDQDDGWKKIRRTSTRFEMFDRINRTIGGLIGRVNCDNTGISDVISAATKVLEAMIKERKLLEGAAFYEDPEKPHGADYAYFVIEADDTDSLEKIYLNYQFRFSAE